jgi:DMSO/TMAO reductase YedYZ heme-binding membrane subunit
MEQDMETAPGDIFRNRTINEWRLFWLVTGPVSLAMIVAMSNADLSSGPGISAMIQLSVRCAVPLLYFAFAASSIQALFPGPFGRWMLRNRKYIGLSFAAAMAWQGFFILWLVTIHGDYYVNEVYVLRDAIEGVVGYVFLFAMTLTSFRFGRKHLTPKQWKWLHKSGIYFLWAYAFSVYWWALFYYKSPVALDYVYYWGGFAAWALRAAAWTKSRQRQSEQGAVPVLRLLGVAVVGIGLVAAGVGSAWQKTAEDLLTGYSLTRIPELYLPYWPFEPFLALFLIAVGAFLLSGAKAPK